jgi:rhodanese-related sulfurtransferase
MRLGPNSPLLTPAKARRLLAPSEHLEQVTLIAWAQASVIRFPELAELVAVPNGGHRHKATAAKLKAEGVRAGYPDLILDVARGGYFGWRGELKRKDGGRVTPEQKAWHDTLRARGYRVDVEHGYENMRDALIRYLSAAATVVWHATR